MGKCRRIVLALLVGGVSLAGLPKAAEAAGRATGNETPKSKKAYIYAPVHNFGDGGGLASRLLWMMEGYAVDTYTDKGPNPPATATPKCRMAFLTKAAGLKFVEAHAISREGERMMMAESFSTEAFCTTAYDAYKTAGWKDETGFPDTWEMSYGYYEKGDYWYLMIHPRGMKNRVKPGNDANETLSFMAVCNSFGWQDSWGGREYFGYDDVICSKTCVPDAQRLASYMSGMIDDGNTRSAGAAYAKGTAATTDPDSRFAEGHHAPCDEPHPGVLKHKSWAQGKTTLSPVVADYFPKTQADLVAVMTNRGAWVQFDTKMVPRTPAFYELDNVSIDWIDAATGEAHWPPIWASCFLWVGEDTLCFSPTRLDLLGGPKAGDTFTFTVRWEHAKSAGNESFLNGNRGPAGADGVAPNKRDFVWTITWPGAPAAPLLPPEQQDVPTGQESLPTESP